MTSDQEILDLLAEKQDIVRQRRLVVDDAIALRARLTELHRVGSKLYRQEAAAAGERKADNALAITAMDTRLSEINLRLKTIGHDGAARFNSQFLLSARELLDQETYQRIRHHTINALSGTRTG